MVKKVCGYCLKEYEAKKANGRFCSDICRVRSNRAKGRGYDAKGMNPFPHSDLPTNYFELLLNRNKPIVVPKKEADKLTPHLKEEKAENEPKTQNRSNWAMEQRRKKLGF